MFNYAGMTVFAGWRQVRYTLFKICNTQCYIIFMNCYLIFKINFLLALGL
jgi:hypothetical protein